MRSISLERKPVLPAGSLGHTQNKTPDLRLPDVPALQVHPWLTRCLQTSQLACPVTRKTNIFLKNALVKKKREIRRKIVNIKKEYKTSIEQGGVFQNGAVDLKQRHVPLWVSLGLPRPWSLFALTLTLRHWNRPREKKHRNWEKSTLLI